MLYGLTAALAVLITSARADTQIPRGGVTPHPYYSSSWGVLGCKININRVAYWPKDEVPISCDKMCKKVTSNGRFVYLLHVDSSVADNTSNPPVPAAYDISYDAWNYLSTGKSATEDPTQGGHIEASYEDADMSDPECQKLLNNGKMPISATNSMTYYLDCPTVSWFRKNAELWNIADPVCTYGVDKTCQPPVPPQNQATCDGGVQPTTPLPASMKVKDIPYGTAPQQPMKVRGSSDARS